MNVALAEQVVFIQWVLRHQQIEALPVPPSATMEVNGHGWLDDDIDPGCIQLLGGDVLELSRLEYAPDTDDG